jgi:photosystem II stability/assembly factor-like uncharacterized protein
MSPTVRSRIRDDVLAKFEPPRSDLRARVLEAISDAGRQSPARRTGRIVFQMAAVAMAALVVAVAVVGARAARGEIELPTRLPFGMGGLHPPAAGYFIVHSQFVSADTGWIFAQLGVQGGPHVLMKTTDGGKTWHEQLRLPDGSGGIGGLRFWNEREGELTWLVPSTLSHSKVPGAPGSMSHVPRVYQTTDGGAHWQVVDRPTDWAPAFGDFFLDRREGWRMIATTEPRQAPILQHTQDGGAHWTSIGTVPADGQLSFTDSLNGWLAVSPSRWFDYFNGRLIPSGDRATLLFQTHDGGRSWAPVELPIPAEGALNLVRIESPIFFGRGDGLLPFEIIQAPPTEPVSGKPMPQGWTKNYLLQTHDGGAHWSNPVLTPGGIQTGAAHFFDARHWLVSQGPTLKETFDGGKTWTSRQVLADGLSFSSLEYIGANLIWAQVGPDRLIRSTDGGAHWTAIRPPTIK